MDRPRPPAHLFDRLLQPFEPDQACEQWIRQTFINPDGPLFNPDHEHLQSAVIGVLWTIEQQTRHMRSVVGQAEITQFQGNKWSRGRQEQQMVAWFGMVPDFVLTFDALFCEQCDDATWCALVEHELYHCGQQTDGLGTPKFRKDGTPAFGIRGHDVEEFVGVVRRYGPTGRVAEMVRAAQGEPEVKRVHIEGACGTCRLNF